ncbi:Ribosomal protein S16 [Gracilaria domingensis]|nr:Ribosomal protein S16 [Gracilaria domingensis]
MVVRIRLARWGQIHRPFYRIVAADARAKRDGRFIEVLGTYNPMSHSRHEAASNIKRVCLNVERIKYWVSVGAQPSDTVSRLLGTAGVLPFSPRVTAGKETSRNTNVQRAFSTRRLDATQAQFKVLE